VREIADLQLGRVTSRVQENLGVTLDIDDSARNALATWGFDPELGARPVKRAIQEHLENPLSKLVVGMGEQARGRTITVSHDPAADALRFEPSTVAPD